MARLPLRSLLLLLALVIAAMFWLRSLAREPSVAAPAPPDTSAERPAPPAPAPAPAAPDAPEAAPPGMSSDVPDFSGTWDVVDLEEVRRAMPENTYWQSSAPSDDPRVLDEREREKARWNEEYGKVLSGNASEDEIRTYFAYRQRVSADAVEFTGYLLDHYGGELPERDVALLELARRLHLARIEELPRKQEEAFERKRQQDAAREAWRRDQEAFEGDNLTEM
jgi:hypothetical protein